MILRRPYAFFIKHFKLLHLFLAALTTYSILRMTNVINFINDYLQSNRTLIKPLEVRKVYNSQDFLIPILTLLFSVLLLSIMTMKKKPNKFYLYSTLVSLGLLIVNLRGKSLFEELTVQWLKVGTLNTLGDFYFFMLLAYIVEVAISISRAIGFNVSRFDFNSDILNLELSEHDNEEVEFVVDFDVNDLKRNTQKRIRYFKYFFKENKSLIKYTIIILMSFAALYSGYSILKYRKKIVSASNFKNSISNFEMTINKSYIINRDLNGNLLEDNKHLIVVDLNIKNTSTTTDASFKPGYLSVNVGNDNYSSVKKYKNIVKDIGTIYNGEKIKANKSIDTLLVFEVPANHLSSKILLGVYEPNGGNKKYVKLSPVKTNKSETEKVENKLGEELNMEKSTLGDTNIKLEKYEIADYYRLNYKYCIQSSNKCIDSYEFLVPNNANSNYDKAILKVVGNFNFSEDSYIKDFGSLISNFGYVEYEKNGTKYTQNTNIRTISGSKVKESNTYYVEILSTIKDADKITLGFKIRNYDYRYILKEGA